MAPSYAASAEDEGTHSCRQRKKEDFKIMLAATAGGRRRAGIAVGVVSMWRVGV